MGEACSTHRKNKYILFTRFELQTWRKYLSADRSVISKWMTENGCVNVDWILFTQHMILWQAFKYMAMNFGLHKIRRISKSLQTIIF